MSVSKKLLADSHLCLLDNGQVALCDHTKKGTIRIHRVISREEITNLIKTLYIQFRHDHPDIQALQLPFGEDSIIAIAALPAPQKADA